jgi:hypothetical protein
MTGEGNQNAKTHGIHSFEAHGPKVLAPFEVDSLQELRELVKTPSGRDDIRVEIVARLVIIARKFFSDAALHQHDNDWWEKGFINKGATYLAELRRYLDGFGASQDKTAEIIEAAIASVEANHGDES